MTENKQKKQDTAPGNQPARLLAHPEVDGGRVPSILRAMHAYRALPIVIVGLLVGTVNCTTTGDKPPEPPPAPSLTSILPAVGDLAGGQVITIRGEHLDGATTVMFGDAEGSSVTVTEGGAALTVLTPPHERALVTVTVTTPGGSASLPNGFSYVRQVTITALDPSRIPANQETTVTVRGTGLIPPLTARVTDGADFSINAAVGTGTDLAVPVTIPALEVGTYFITVTNGENQLYTGTSTPLTVTEPIRVTEVDPAGGFADETTFVRITGTGFNGVTAVLVANAPCTGLLVNPTELECTVPAGIVGPADVVVRRTPGDETRVTAGFTYYAASDAMVRVLYADPRAGRSTGGQTTMIAATGLGLGTPTVTIGGQAAAVQMVQDGKRALVTLPPYAVLTNDVFTRVPVSVTVSGQTDTRQNAFTYYIRPGIASVMPAKAATVGGDLITILGEGFTDDRLRVTVGINNQMVDATEVTRLSPTRISCRVPPHAAGMVDMEVYSRFDVSPVATAVFEYVEAVRVTQLEPSSVSIAGGTLVEATGSGFVAGRMEVRVGGAVISGATVLSNNTMRFVMPRRDQVGQVEVAIEDTNALDPTLSTGRINVDYLDKTLPYGGVTGGPVNRNVEVSVIRQDSGAPLSGVEVFLGDSWSGAQFRGTTDDRGMLVMAGTMLSGPVTVTAARQGFENQTFVDVDGWEVSFALLAQPVDCQMDANCANGYVCHPQFFECVLDQPAPQVATLTGQVAGWPQAGLPGGAAPGQVKRFAMVWVSEPDQGLQPPDPGDFNIVAEEPCDISADGVNNPLGSTFTINAYPGTRVALLAAVYFYNSGNGICEPGGPQNPNMEGEGLVQVTAGAMGLLTDVMVQPGTNPGLVIPVNRTVTDGLSVTFTGAPIFGAGAGGTARTLDFILDVGASGVFTFINPYDDLAQWNSSVAIPGAPAFLGFPPESFFFALPTAIPSPGGDLKYILRGLSGAPQFNMNNQLVGFTQPQSEIWQRNVQTFQNDLNTWFQFPTGMQPAQGGILTNRTFHWNAVSRAHSVLTVDVGQLDSQDRIIPVWSVLMPSGKTSLQMPDLTGAPNVTDLTAGTNLWQLGAYSVFETDGFDYNAHGNEELGEAHLDARMFSEPQGFNMP